MKTQYRPIAMRCTQEQFDSIKDRIPLPIWCHGNFDKRPYIVNNYCDDKMVGNVQYPISYTTDTLEQFDGELFLDCCGREKEDKQQFPKLGIEEFVSVYFCGQKEDITKKRNEKMFIKYKLKNISNCEYYDNMGCAKVDCGCYFTISEEHKDIIIKEYLKDKVWTKEDIVYRIVFSDGSKTDWQNTNSKIDTLRPRKEYKFNFNPDYSKEIELLEKKAKENGQKVIIKFE